MLKEVELATRLKDGPAFWSRVRKTDTCWLWTGHLNHRGYGRYGKIGAHRLAYIMVNGPIPTGYETDHLCRVHNCVNPAHIEAVTKRVNILRGESFSAKNAAKQDCVYGHPLSMTGSGRRCAVCRKENNKKIAARRKHERKTNPSKLIRKHCPTCGAFIICNRLVVINICRRCRAVL